MSFPTTSILDTFNRPNGSPGANWSTLIGSEAVPSITSGALVWAAGTESFRWNPFTAGPDCEVYADVPGDNISLWARVVTPPATGQPLTGYVVYLDALRTRLSLWKADGTGFTTQVAGSPVTDLPTCDGVGLRCVGSTLTAYTRASGVWTQRLLAVDVAHSAAGYLGGELFAAGSSIDNFGGGTFTGDNPPIPHPPTIGGWGA